MTARSKAEALVALAESFGKALSENAIEMWLDATSDLTDAEFAAAASRCVRECRFMPVPADLRERAGHGVTSCEDKALRAWAEAWDAASTHGAYRSVMFTDNATTRTIQAMGGWPAFCRPDQEEQWHRKEFLETYRAMLGEQLDGELPLRLPGIHERTGSTNQHCLVIGEMPPEQRKLLESKSTSKSDEQVMRDVTNRMKALSAHAPTGD